MKHWFSTKTFEVNGKTIRQPFGKIKIYLLIFALIFFGSFVFINTDQFVFQFNQLSKIIEALFRPRSFNDIHGNTTYDTWAHYFEYMWNLRHVLFYTIKMCFIGTFVGSVFAIPFSLFCANNVNSNHWMVQIARAILNFIRTIPTLVIALIAVFFLGLGYLPGIIAISIFSFSILSKMLYEVIETIDMGPCEALESCGANKLKVIKLAIMPQIMPIIWGYVLYIFEINIRASVILGYVGAGGIGQEMQDAMELRRYDKVGAILIVLMLLVMVLQFVVGKVRGHYDEAA